jgi:lipopolysaccharide/colanic/teichoic acid biosynthesis glycosyltransferase
LSLEAGLVRDQLSDSDACVRTHRLWLMMMMMAMMRAMMMMVIMMLMVIVVARVRSRGRIHLVTETRIFFKKKKYTVWKSKSERQALADYSLRQNGRPRYFVFSVRGSFSLSLILILLFRERKRVTEDKA